MEDKSLEKVHFIGVGGVGMSGIAIVARRLGMQVSGSDLKESKHFKNLRAEGVDAYVGHDAAAIGRVQPDVVVVSSAIRETNPELVAAREAGIEVWPRAKMLAYVCRNYKVLAVAGTHGKTTTSSLLAASLVELGADPAFLVGGIIDGFDTNARFGQGDYCAIEADESDGSFTFLDPFVAIVTNIEADHLDHYANIGEIEEAFAEFVGHVPEDGCVIACGDDERLAEVVRSSAKAPVVLYGLDEGNDVRVVPGEGGAFTVLLPDGSAPELRLAANPGVHNMLNAAAVVTALTRIGFSADDCARAVASFTGVRRRFDHVGECGGIVIVDDYGHHPTEIAATLTAARSMDYKRIHVLFQPHRYSRTQALAAEFGTAFADADRVVVMDVYSAGETPIPGITGKTVADAVLAVEPGKDIVWAEGREGVPELVAEGLEPGDLLITMGAGDVTAMGPLVLAVLREKGQE